MTGLAALLGLGAGVGLWLIIRGLTCPPERVPTWVRVRRQASTAVSSRQRLTRLAACVVVAVVVATATRWMVGALLAGVAVWWLPQVLGPDRVSTARITRFEAIASWAEMLRDTLAAAAGLEQAILVTAPLTADPIRAHVTAAAAKLQAGQRLAPVLRDLADELSDPTADLVLSALVMAAEQRARDLAELLGSLARAARESAAQRMSTAAHRAQARSEVRITVAVTLLMTLGLIGLDRHYLRPYDSAAGQFVLLLVGALFAAGFALSARIARIPEPARLLAQHSRAEQPSATADGSVR